MMIIGIYLCTRAFKGHLWLCCPEKYGMKLIQYKRSFVHKFIQKYKITRRSITYVSVKVIGTMHLMTVMHANHNLYA